MIIKLEIDDYLGYRNFQTLMSHFDSVEIEDDMLKFVPNCLGTIYDFGQYVNIVEIGEGTYTIPMYKLELLRNILDLKHVMSVVEFTSALKFINELRVRLSC